MALRKEQQSLKKWSDQKWRTSDGSESKGKKRYLPDRAWDALSPGEKAATNRAKKSGDEKGEQFVAQPEKIAKKTASYRKLSEELVLRIRHLAKKDPEIHEIDADNQDLFSFRKYERSEEVIPALVEETGAAAGGAAAAPSAPSGGGEASAPSDSGPASPSQPAEGGSEEQGEATEEKETEDKPKARTGSRYYHIPGYRTGFVSPYPFLKFSKKRKKKKEEETLSEEYYLLNEAKASDIKGTGRVANLAREYLTKYPTKFTFRANKHVETLEKYLGPKAKEVVRVVIGGYFVQTSEGPQWSGTAAVAFTNDKVFVAQKGLLFGTENVKTINRDKIDDVQITRGIIYGMFTIHARSEYLVVGVLHKNALEELQEFLEMYADAKIKIRVSREADVLSKQVVNESLAEALANLNEDMFRVTLTDQGGQEVEYPYVEADSEDEAITKAIDSFDVDAENIKSVERLENYSDGGSPINTRDLRDFETGGEGRKSLQMAEASDADKPKKKSEVDDMIDELNQKDDLSGVVSSAIKKSVEAGPQQDWDQPEENETKYHPDRIVPQDEIDREEIFKKNVAAYNKQRMEGVKSGKPFIDDYGGDSGNLYFVDPNSGKRFKKKIPINPATGKQYEMWEFVGTDDWNVEDPQGYRDPKTGELVLKDGKPLLNSAPVGEELYVLTEKLTRPHKGEDKQEFVSRFMSDKLAKKEFKDNKQRVAVAYNQWERGGLREDVPSDQNEEDWGRYIAAQLRKGTKTLEQLEDEYKVYKVNRIIPVNEETYILEAKKHPLLVKHGVEGFNKPKRTPGHKTKSHLVVAKKEGKIRVVRFGSQGASGSPAKEGESSKWKNRRQNWVKRHKAQNPSGFKDKFSALYWANKVKW
jgi:hypothetical protein